MTDVHRIVLLGDTAVGKTALVTQLCRGRFVSTHQATVEDSYQHHLIVDSIPCRLDVLDTAGEVNFTGMRLMNLKEGEAFILVYDVTNRHSFLDIKSYYEQLIKAKRGDHNVVAILVGNKADDIHSGQDMSGSDPDSSSPFREVTTEQGVELAKILDVPFIETCCMRNSSVVPVFECIVKKCRLAVGTPCRCRGDCTCDDECEQCRKPRKLHTNDMTHQFKKVEGCCSIQ